VTVNTKKVSNNFESEKENKLNVAIQEIKSKKIANMWGFTVAIEDLDDLDGTDKDQNTLLHYTVIYNQPKMAKILVEYGAKFLPNAEGKTPRDLAETIPGWKWD